MKDKLDHYDLIAVMCTGLLATFTLLGIMYKYDIIPMSSIAGISLGDALSLGMFSFIVGDLVQSISKFVERYMLIGRGKEKATYWICDDYAKKGKNNHKQVLPLPESSIELIREEIGVANNSPKKALNVQELKNNFYVIKRICYQDPEEKQILLRLMTKANVSRAYVTIALMVIMFVVAYPFFWLCKNDADSGFWVNFLDYLCHPCLYAPVLIPAVALCILKAQHYKEYSVKYAQSMLSFYASYLSRKKDAGM